MKITAPGQTTHTNIRNTGSEIHRKNNQKAGRIPECLSAPMYLKPTKKFTYAGEQQITQNRTELAQNDAQPTKLKSWRLSAPTPVTLIH